MPKPTPKFGGNKKDNNQAMDEATVWMHELVKWCQDVRSDILRLEGDAGLSKGDPGPPPEEPWE